MNPKTTIFIILLTFVYSSIYAQEAVNGFDADGKRHGTWQKTYEGNTNVRYEGQFEHGKEVGRFTYYANNPKKLLVATRDFKPGSDEVLVTYYASNGNIMSQGVMTGKEREGEWKYFHKNSKVVMNIENYANGKLHGTYETFYKNGQLIESVHYEHGLRNGKSFTYYPNGKKSGEFVYNNDKLHGEVKYYDVEGRPTSEGRYKNDKRVGIWKFYKEGNLVETKNYTPIKNPKYKNK